MGWRACNVKRNRAKMLKTRQFVEQCLSEGITSPSEMRDRYNQTYGLEGEKAKTRFAFTKAMRRMGISASKRLELKHEAQKETEVKDIEEYEEVHEYLAFGKGISGIQKYQIDRTLRDLRKIWEWMNYTNPQTWKLSSLIDCLENHIPKDNNGKWGQPSRVLCLLGAFNRTFQGYLPKGWSMGLKRDPSELKDFLEFDEFEEFIANLRDTRNMKKEGWKALYKAEVNSGARGGAHSTKSSSLHGILSLRWEHINFNTRRCSIRDKGKKRKPARLWKEIPLDLFYWINGWEALVKWHEQSYGYRPTQERHAMGRCFPIGYTDYLRMFDRTRHGCHSRIAQDVETMKPHIFRKTHAQWCARLRIPLHWICGQFPYAWYGVGWDDPKILLRYYLTIEPDEMQEINKKMSMRIEKLGLNAPLIA